MTDTEREVNREQSQVAAEAPARPVETDATGGAPIPLADAILQAKLTVGPSNDPHEREADLHADRVVESLRSPSAASTASAPPSTADAVGRIRRAPSPDGTVGLSGGGLDPQTEQQIQRARGGGQPMPQQVRGDMEGAFGTDFGEVRVHQGSEAAELNDKVQAKAFAVGHDIFFRDGLPDTNSTDGQHLLAHELTHVVQQTGSAERRIQRSDQPPETRALERDVGPRIQRSVASIGKAPVSVQRTGEAKACEEWLVKARTRANEWRDLLGKSPAPSVVRDLKKEIDGVMVEARQRVLAAENDTGYNSRKGRITGQMQFFEAREKDAKEALDEVLAGEAVTGLDEVASKLESGIGGVVESCNVFVVTILERLRSSTSATTLEQIAGDRKTAADAQDSVAKQIAKITDQLSTFSTKTDKQLVVASQSLTHSGTAHTHRERVASAVDLLTKMMAVMQRDADAAMAGIESLHRTMQAVSAAKDDLAQKHIAAAPLARAARLANKEYGAAKQRSAEAGAAAALAEEALTSAHTEFDRASGELQTAEQEAAQATARAASLSKAIAVYERHLSRAPSTQGDELIALRRAEAAAAESAAAEATESAESKNEPKAEAERERDARASEAQPLVATRDSTAEEAALAKEGRDATALDARSAKTEVAEATTTFKEKGSQHDQAVVSAISDKTALETTRGDGSRERTELRVHLGDAAVTALTAVGLSDTVITSNLVAIQSLIGQHGTAAAALIRDARAAGFNTPDTLTTFAAQATSAQRGRDVLACVGTTAAWFAAHGVGGAGSLLTHGWAATDVKSVMVAAEAAPALNAATVGWVTNLVTKTALSPTDTVKLLNDPAMTKFLDLSGIKAIQRLLKSTPTPTMTKIIDLVKAADLLCKPSSSEFDKFCKLALAKPATLDQAITMLKSADCTADFLNKIALDAMFIAVTDGWSIAELKPVVKAAKGRSLSKVQFDRFMLLVKTEGFTKPNAKKCLETSEVADWTVLLTCADNFIAQGNKAAPVAVPGAAQTTAQGDPAITFQVTQERAEHFAAGHTYKHYEMSEANIFRGGGNQPSSMWAPTKTVTQIVGDAIAAAGTPGVVAQARHAINNTGTKGTFDQNGYAGYVIGVERVNGTKVKITQFFPTGASATAVQNHTMNAIKRLFGR